MFNDTDVPIKLQVTVIRLLCFDTCAAIGWFQ